MLTRQVTDVLGGVRGCVDDGETSRHDAEEQGDRDAGNGGDVQLFDEKGALVVEDVNEVHVEVSLAEAVVQVLAAFEQPEEDGSRRLVARFAHSGCLDPVVRAQASCKTEHNYDEAFQSKDFLFNTKLAKWIFCSFVWAKIAMESLPA